MGWTLGIFVLITAVYVGAFWFLGWRIERRKPLPALGWSLLGAFARWVSDFFLAFLFVVLSGLRQPLGLALAILALSRFVIWAVLAHLLYQPDRKPLIHFGVIMTLVNAGFDLMLFGAPGPSELLEPFRWGNLH